MVNCIIKLATHFRTGFKESLVQQTAESILTSQTDVPHSQRRDHSVTGLCDSGTDGELQMFHVPTGTAALARLMGFGVGVILNAKSPSLFLR